MTGGIAPMAQKIAIGRMHGRDFCSLPYCAASISYSANETCAMPLFLALTIPNARFCESGNW